MIKCFVNVFGLVLFTYLGTVFAAEVTTDQFPYLASIQAPGFRGRRHVCNGVVINENWILTTGGCVEHFEDPHAYKIRIGGTNNFDGDDYTVERKEFHPLYAMNMSDYNLALLRVQTPVKFNDHAKSIEIVASTLPVRADQTGVLAGWSYSYENRYEEVILNSLEVVTLENGECNVNDSDNKLCTRIIKEEPPTSMCNGADGSPLVINNTLVAIATYGVGCQQESKTRIVTPINDEIKKWISATIK